MNVRIVVELVVCYLQYSKLVMYAHQATGRIVLREEEVVNLRHPTGVSQSGLSCVPLQKFMLVQIPHRSRDPMELAI